MENTEIKESVPQIKLMSTHSVNVVTLHYLVKTSCNKAKGIAHDDRSTGMKPVTRKSAIVAEECDFSIQ